MSLIIPFGIGDISDIAAPPRLISEEERKMNPKIENILHTPIRDWMKTAVYFRYLPGIPDVIVGCLPTSLCSGPHDEWKIWICESTGERNGVLNRLAEPCPITEGAIDFSKGPDAELSRPALGMNPGELHDTSVALYAPPKKGWPWLLLQSSTSHIPGLERGRYSWQLFASQAEAVNHLKFDILARSLGKMETLEFRTP